MSSITIAVPTKGDIRFDLSNEIAYIEDTIDDLTGQELYNAARDAEDANVANNFEKIVDGEGKAFLGTTSLGNKQTGATVTLLRAWKLQSEKTSGALLVFEANVVNATDGAEIFNDVAGVSQVNILIGDGVEVVVNVGSGVTPSDIIAIKDAIYDELVNDSEDFRKSVQRLLGRLALDKSNPLTTNDDNSIQFDDVTISAVNGATDTVQTRDDP